jgi:uncharacterized membrane protein YccC
MAKKTAADGAADTGIRLSRHPKARRHIAMAKSWGGLGAFLIVLYLSLGAGLPTSDAILRGMLGGLIGYLAGWVIAVSVWRHLALAELESLRRRLVASMEAQAAQAAAATGTVVTHDDPARAPAEG